MAGKPSKGVVAGVAIAIAGGLAAVALVFVLMMNGAPAGGSPGAAPAPKADPNGNQVGPDMGALNPAQHPTATPTSQPTETAGLLEPAAPAPATDPQVQTASAPKGDDIPLGDIVFKDAALEFTAVFPPASAASPALVDIRTDANDYLKRVRFNARDAYQQAKRSGETPRPWIVKIKWDYTAKAGDIISLVGTASEDTGGAHPRPMIDTHIARAKTGQPIKFNDMLRGDRQPSPALTIAVCEALKAEKTKRIKSPTIFDEPIVCVGRDSNAKVEQAKFALAPSDQPNHFGGVYVFYAPYDVGAYAEGSYELAVQQELFAEDLRPDFKPLFGGTAPPLKN